MTYTGLFDGWKLRLKMRNFSFSDRLVYATIARSRYRALPPSLSHPLSCCSLFPPPPVFLHAYSGIRPAPQLPPLCYGPLFLLHTTWITPGYHLDTAWITQLYTNETAYKPTREQLDRPSILKKKKLPNLILLILSIQSLNMFSTRYML